MTDNIRFPRAARQKKTLLTCVQSLAKVAQSVGHDDLSRDLALVVIKHVDRDKKAAEP